MIHICSFLHTIYNKTDIFGNVVKFFALFISICIMLSIECNFNLKKNILTIGDIASSTEPSIESPILIDSFPSIFVFSWFTGFQACWITLDCLKSIQANPVNQEKTSLDGKLALRIGDSLLGSVEDAASSPSLPKKIF